LRVRAATAEHELMVPVGLTGLPEDRSHPLVW
jgi:hypothetical protein